MVVGKTTAVVLWSIGFLIILLDCVS